MTLLFCEHESNLRPQSMYWWQCCVSGLRIPLLKPDRSRWDPPYHPKSRSSAPWHTSSAVWYFPMGFIRGTTVPSSILRSTKEWPHCSQCWASTLIWISWNNECWMRVIYLILFSGRGHVAVSPQGYRHSSRRWGLPVPQTSRPDTLNSPFMLQHITVSFGWKALTDWLHWLQTLWHNDSADSKRSDTLTWLTPISLSKLPMQHLVVVRLFQVDLWIHWSCVRCCNNYDPHSSWQAALLWNSWHWFYFLNDWGRQSAEWLKWK